MANDRIGERLPQPRQDQDRPQPHGADAQGDVAQQRHQLQDDVEQRDRDQAAQPEGDQLVPRHPVRSGRTVLVRPPHQHTAPSDPTAPDRAINDKLTSSSCMNLNVVER